MDFEIRSAKGSLIADMDQRTLVGLAAVYNVRAQFADFDEQIEPGAFREILRTDPDVVLLVNHNPSQILGRTSSGTLHLAEDHKGLNFGCTLPDTQLGRDTWQSVKRGDLNGASFAFRLNPEHQTWEQRDGKAFRRIHGFAALQDVSCVTFPAYEKGTHVDARQLNVVPAEVRSMATQLVAPYRRTLDAEFDKVMKQTSDFVLDELHVSLQWDHDLKPRSIPDQMKLMRMATNLVEMRAQGWNVEVVYDDRRFPQRIVYAGPTKEERAAATATMKRRQKFLREFLLN